MDEEYAGPASSGGSRKKLTEEEEYDFFEGLPKPEEWHEIADTQTDMFDHDMLHGIAALLEGAADQENERSKEYVMRFLQNAKRVFFEEGA